MSSHEPSIGADWLELLGRLLLAILSATSQLGTEPLATRPIEDFLSRRPTYSRPEVSTPTPPVRSIVITTPRPRAQTSTGWIQDPEVSWYGPGFYGKRTACGHAYTTQIMGVAHRSLPCGTLVQFRWNGRTETVPVIDRGPYVEGRTWDLSGGLCTALDHCFTGPIEWRFP